LSKGQLSSGRSEDSSPFTAAQVMSRKIWKKRKIKKSSNVEIIRLDKDWQLGGSELDSQEREKSGTKQLCKPAPR
jgi:hypothetical protein